MKSLLVQNIYRGLDKQKKGFGTAWAKLMGRYEIL